MTQQDIITDYDPIKTLLLIIIALILPPLAVAIKVGLSTNFWLNILFTIFGFWIVGIIHAIVVILKD